MRQTIRTITVDSGKNVFVHIGRRRARDAAVPDLSELSREFKGKPEEEVRAALKKRGVSDLVVREVVRRTRDKRTRDNWTVERTVRTPNGMAMLLKGAGEDRGKWGIDIPKQRQRTFNSEQEAKDAFNAAVGPTKLAKR